MEYTEQEKIVLPEDGEGGWVDTHPTTDILIEGSGTAEMSSEEKVKNIFEIYRSVNVCDNNSSLLE